MTLPTAFERYRERLNAAMRSHLYHREGSAYDVLRYNMGWVDADAKPIAARTGKALRPTLCLLTCEAVGGDPTLAIPGAISVEFIHNFSLVHDDIQDHDEVRWGRPTVWSIWGKPKALVAGNLLRTVADQALWNLNEQGVDYTVATKVVHLLTKSYLSMIEGQYLDVAYEGHNDTGLTEYLDMISRKTGALISCSVHIGAVIGTKDALSIKAFQNFGRSLGYVFQIRDDMLGTWGEEKKTGKPVGSDIKRKKKALPIVHAMSQAKGTNQHQLKSIYAKNEISGPDVEVVLDIMTTVGSEAYAENLVQEHGSRAMEAIHVVDIPPSAKREISQIVEFLLIREY